MELHFEHFVLQHFEVLASSKSIPALLAIYIRLILKVVWARETSKTIVVCIAFIIDTNVIATSKGWAIVCIAVNCVLRLRELHFLFEVHLQQERFPSVIHSVSTTCNLVPFERSVACDRSVEISADDGESVLNIVAMFVELCCAELVFWCSIKQPLGGSAVNWSA